MDAKDLLKKVRKVEIKTKRLSNNLFGGEYHSAFKGRGMTFSEVRGYEFGDDVRTIDWNNMKIRVKGDEVISWINGVEMVSFKDKKIGKGEGGIALQIHDGGGIKVKWKNILLTKL